MLQKICYMLNYMNEEGNQEYDYEINKDTDYCSIADSTTSDLASNYHSNCN